MCNEVLGHLILSGQESVACQVRRLLGCASQTHVPLDITSRGGD